MKLFGDIVVMVTSEVAMLSFNAMVGVVKGTLNQWELDGENCLHKSLLPLLIAIFLVSLTISHNWKDTLAEESSAGGSLMLVSWRSDTLTCGDGEEYIQ